MATCPKRQEGPAARIARCGQRIARARQRVAIRTFIKRIAYIPAGMVVYVINVDGLRERVSAQQSVLL